MTVTFGPDVCDIDIKRRILHYPTREKEASGLRVIRLESTDVHAFNGVCIETNWNIAVDT